MKEIELAIPWEEGLHMRPATKLVQSAQKHQSTIRIKVGEKVADACSILSVILLCASFGTKVKIEVSGEDETQALATIEKIFQSDISLEQK